MATARKTRLLLVYNPRSSQANRIEREVLRPLRAATGLSFGRFEVEAKKMEINAERLAKVLCDGDAVVVAGGDGAVAVAVNGCMLSQKEVRLAVLPYGNFNDTARSLGVKKRGSGEISRILAKLDTSDDQSKEIYPLEVRINGKLWRYVVSYVTVGMLAASTMVFDEPKIRKRLQKKKHNFSFSLTRLASWYFKNRKKHFLRDMRLNGEKTKGAKTDYLAVNSKTVGKMMRGGDWMFKPEVFLSGTAKINRLLGLFGFMLRAVLVSVPLKEVKKAELSFEKAEDLAIQSEGECQVYSNVSRIEIKKCQKGIKII